MGTGNTRKRAFGARWALLGWLAQGVALAQTDTTFVSLFNGTDLTDWTLKSAATDIKDFAKVKDGYIDLESPGGSGWLWLYSAKEYTDFVFKTKFSAPTGEQGNSGVNFRSLWDPNDQGGYLNGPQVDIYTANNWRTGLILDMTKGNERWLYPNLPNWTITKQNTPTGWTFKYFPEWNDLEIRMVGNQVTTIVNGVKQADWNGTSVLTDALHTGKNVGRKGYIALQAHSDQKVVIYFKDIRIADLSAPSGIQAPRAIGSAAPAPIAASGERLYSLDGKRVEPSAPGRTGQTGLYVAKGAGAPRLRVMMP